MNQGSGNKRKYIEVEDDDEKEVEKEKASKLQRRDSGIVEKVEEEVCKITVYTDGSCRAQTDGSECQCVGRAGYGIYFPPFKVSDKTQSNATYYWGRVPGKEQNSSRAEITAIIRAIQLCPDKNAQLYIFTDYQGSVNLRPQYRSWTRKKAKADMDLWTELRREMYLRKHIPITKFVKGHSGDHGNTMADKYARKGTQIKCEKDGFRTTMKEVAGKVTKMVEVLESL